MSYQRIIRSTAVIGGASSVVIVFRLVRLKILAAFLGPEGVGLFGMYSVIIGSVAGLAGLGLGSSAVREIAAARASEDGARLRATIAALRWLSVVLALGGAAVLLASPGRIAQMAFGAEAQEGAVAWLSIGVAVTVLTASLTAVVQGFGRIGDLARIDVLGAVVGSLVGVVFLLTLGERGVIGLVLAPMVAFLVAAVWYARKIPRSESHPAPRAILRQARAMLALGFSFMGAGLAVSWVQLGLKSYITRQGGLEATGIYQAAWGISFVYIGFILSAMGRDYYPRITAIISDARAAGVLVNEQMRVALVFGGPILIIVMAFAEPVISLVFASSFHAAVPVLRWMILGNILKLMSWPLAFVILAKGKGLIFLATEVAANSLLLLMAIIGYEVLGLTGTGIAFLLLYLVYFPLVFFIGRYLIRFQLARRNWILAGVLMAANIAIFSASYWSDNVALVLGAVLSGAFSVLAWRELTHMIGQNPLEWAAAAVREKLDR